MLNARVFLILAVDEVATSALFAVTATAGEEPDTHALAHTPTFDALAKGINHPDGLVARHPWPLDREYAVDRRSVRMTDAARLHANSHVAGARVR